MRNPDKDETLNLGGVLAECEHRKTAHENKAAAKAARSRGEGLALSLGRRLTSAWTAFRAAPAKRAGS